MSTIPETNFRFEFAIEIFKNTDRYIWKILDHKNQIVGKSVNSFETKEECKSDLSRLSNSIKDFLTN